MRIVLDTSVLIAALRSNAGAAAEVIRLALLGELTLLMDYKLACEYRDVAFRREHVAASGKTRSEIEAVLEAVETIAEPVDIVNRFRPLSQDVNDDMVLDVAINGSADAILTHNTKHFREAARRFHLLVQTPAELLVRLKERRS